MSVSCAALSALRSAISFNFRPGVGCIRVLATKTFASHNSRSFHTSTPQHSPTRPWAPLKGPTAKEILEDLKDLAERGLRYPPTKMLHQLSQKIYTTEEIEYLKEALELYRRNGVPVVLKHADAISIQLRKKRGAMQKRSVQAQALADIFGDPQRYRLFVRPDALHPCVNLMVEFGHYLEALTAIQSNLEPPVTDTRVATQVWRVANHPQTFPRIMDVYLASRNHRHPKEHYEMLLDSAIKYGASQDVQDLLSDYEKHGYIDTPLTMKARIEGCIKSGQLEEAVNLLQKVPSTLSNKQPFIPLPMRELYEAIKATGSTGLMTTFDDARLHITDKGFTLPKIQKDWASPDSKAFSNADDDQQDSKAKQ